MQVFLQVKQASDLQVGRRSYIESAPIDRHDLGEWGEGEGEGGWGQAESRQLLQGQLLNRVRNPGECPNLPFSCLKKATCA
jgi:hypothetical protein